MAAWQEVRAAAAEGMGFLGVEPDTERNDAAHPDENVATTNSAAAVPVVAAREDLEIARQVRGLLER